MTATKKACVIGDPINHSLSPRLHGYWLKHYQIEGSYEAIHVSADALEGFLSSLHIQNYVGCNITLPHKEAAMNYMDKISDIARRIGAINTVVVREGGSLYGTNTDAYGFIENIKQQVPDLSPYKHKAMVLGAGGAARAVCVALQDEGCEVVLTNRTQEKADIIADNLGNISVVAWDEKEAALADATMLVNTTSLGMAGKAALELSLERLSPKALVTDIVYKPLYTDLLSRAKDRGNKIVTGIGMLLHQAAPGFEAWFGRQPSVDDNLEKYVLEQMTS